MLTPEQELLARTAFENDRKALYGKIAKKMREQGQLGLIERFESPKFDRRTDGHYADPILRVDWSRWSNAWAACLEANP